MKLTGLPLANLLLFQPLVPLPIRLPEHRPSYILRRIRYMFDMTLGSGFVRLSLFTMLCIVSFHYS